VEFLGGFFMVYDIDINQLNIGPFKLSFFGDEIAINA
jgi:hypothetical protein